MREWEELLEREKERLITVLTSPSEDARRLRSSSPFAGVIPPRETMGAAQGAQGQRVKRQDLEHIIRAAGAVTESDKLIVIGSQAILGQ
jgi:hypothetical protein